MKTLLSFLKNAPAIPATTAWYIESVAESKGRQELFTRQSPQKLKTLREHALIESAVSSNRIEGVTIAPSRVATVVLGKPPFKNRNEEEIGGYREALNIIHGCKQDTILEVSESTILNIHKMTKGDIGYAGKYKEKDGDIIETYPDGSSRVRFKTVTANDTPQYMRELIKLWDELTRESKIPFIVLLAAFNLDFLCIHPFRDGNGRVSRLLMLLQAYHGGFSVGRYISIERLIEENKVRYYEALEQSSYNWHKGMHDPWPYIQFVSYMFKCAYKEFEERLSQIKGAPGEKRLMIEDAIIRKNDSFTVQDIQNQCHGVSIDTIRKVLKNMQKDGRIECLSKGRSAKWKLT